MQVVSHFEPPKAKSLFAPGGEPQLRAITQLDFPPEDQAMFAAHIHEDELEIVLIAEGQGTRLCGEERYSVQKGDLLIHNPGVVHEENTERGNTLSYSCMLTGMRLVGMPYNILLPKGECPVLHTGSQFESIRTLLELICRLLQEQPTGYPETVGYLLQSFVAAVIGLLEERRQNTVVEEAKTEDKDKNYICELARQYINENYTEELTLERISKALRISPSYLSHIFKQGTGYSPMQYVNLRRLGEAQFLLISTQDRLTEIALKTGFDTSNNFYKMFMKQVGMSPSDFRKVYFRGRNGENHN